MGVLLALEFTGEAFGRVNELDSTLLWRFNQNRSLFPVHTYHPILQLDNAAGVCQRRRNRLDRPPRHAADRRSTTDLPRCRLLASSPWFVVASAFPLIQRGE
jgi:hypothetical protein